MRKKGHIILVCSFVLDCIPEVLWIKVDSSERETGNSMNGG